MQKFTVSQESQNQRLDVFVSQRVPELSRSSIQKLLADGKVLVNEHVQPNKYKVRSGDEVIVYFDPNSLSEIPSIKLPIVYEDDDCVVINKPPGILTHSKGGFNSEATVASFIRSKLTNLEGERAGIVHRLDRATSGIIICAKTPESLSWLQKQFAQRKAKKTYLAVIEGKMDPSEAVIDMPIARNPRNPKTFHVSETGKSAETHYQTLQTNNSYSLLKLEPKTGRTHQLRVHLSQQGHPIIGDTLYAGKDFERVLLHAYKLELILPSRERKTFVAEPQQVFHTIVND